MLKFAQRAFENFRVVPPGTGIVHQVNLEYLSPCVQLRDQHGELTAYPDTLVGTDSHTTMINGLGVLGWGVGGIEAEAVMLGQPYFMLMPEVIGVRLTGALPAGCTATDLVLTVTQMLRKHGVVDKFVEFFGPGLASAAAGRPRDDRQHGARVRRHGAASSRSTPRRSATSSAPVATRSRSPWSSSTARRSGSSAPPTTAGPGVQRRRSRSICATVVPSVAGPKRPQDLVPLTDLSRNFAVNLPGLMQPTVAGSAARAGAGGARALDQRRRRGRHGHASARHDVLPVRDQRRGARTARRRRS